MDPHFRWECWRPLGGCGKQYAERPEGRDAKGGVACPSCGRRVVECRVMVDRSAPSVKVDKVKTRGRDGKYVA